MARYDDAFVDRFADVGGVGIFFTRTYGNGEAADDVRCDGDALPWLATDRVVAVGDCAGGRLGSACDRKRFP